MTLILKNMIHHGQVRACYYHPEDPQLCVKVALCKKHSKLLKKEIESNEVFQKTLSPYVTPYYGLVPTNYGLGLVSELITDSPTNTLSPRLRDWLKIHKTISKELLPQFQDFFERLLKHNLWFYDFNDENFLIQKKNNNLRLVFVDTKSLNRNNSWSFLKLEYVIPALAKIRMKRRIHRFYESHGIKIPQTLK